jgi:hypothetical protein
MRHAQFRNQEPRIESAHAVRQQMDFLFKNFKVVWVLQIVFEVLRTLSHAAGTIRLRWMGHNVAVPSQGVGN